MSSTMPLLDTTLLSSQRHTHTPALKIVTQDGKSQPRNLKSKGSLAAISSLIRDPVGAFGEFAQGWADGLTKEERQAKIHLSARKQLLYLRMRDVSSKFRHSPRVF
jgi:hypothetical protein